MNFDYKHHITTDGLNHGIDLEADKCNTQYDEYIKRNKMIEQAKQKAKNRHLNPEYMIVDDKCNQVITTIDPEEMTFNFKNR